MTITKNQFIDEWKKDLLSGKFKQGQGRLQSPIGYCCLGVACETGTRLEIEGADFKGAWNNKPQDSFPGLWFKKIMGSKNPMVTTELGQKKSLDQLNDRDKFTFTEIAELLDQLKDEY